MPDWLTSFATTLTGMPWGAGLAVIVITLVLREGIPKGVDALLRIWGFGFEQQKYKDSTKKTEKDALVDAFKAQIEELKQRQAHIEGLLTTCHDQHIEGVRQIGMLTGKVEVLTSQNSEQRKQMAELKQEVDRLTRHEQVNLAAARSAAVKEIQDQAAEGSHDHGASPPAH